MDLDQSAGSRVAVIDAGSPPARCRSEHEVPFGNVPDETDAMVVALTHAADSGRRYEPGPFAEEKTA